MANQYTADITRLTTNDSGPRDPARCQLAVVHTYECPRGDDLENRAAYQEQAGSSYTVLVGIARTLRANDDNYIPWAAAYTGNLRGLHASFLAYAADPRSLWLHHMRQLEKGADVVADWCRRYGIPPVKLTADQVRAGQRGICGHAEISGAWRETDHTDPGPNFPWDVFINLVKQRLNPTTPKEDDMTPAQEKKLDAALSEIRALRKDVTDIRLQQGSGDDYSGFPQGGRRTLYDLAAATAEKVGVPATSDTKGMK
ncbi:peptidoglycan recognition protein family protein [Corynebacterium kalidii]